MIFSSSILLKISFSMYIETNTHSTIHFSCDLVFYSLQNSEKYFLTIAVFTNKIKANKQILDDICYVYLISKTCCVSYRKF